MARRGYSKRLPFFFFENGEVPLPLPTSQAALVFCRQHGLLISYDVSSAQRFF